MNIKLIQTPLKDIKKIVYSKFIDNRGSFQRLFCNKELKKLKFKVKQINLSINLKKNTFRGFHYQNKNKEKKIIKVLKGSLIFYVLNINKYSSDYLKSFKIKISEKDNFGLYISDCYATAYFTTEKNTQIIYLMNNYYNPKYAKVINYKDPKIKIKLPRKPFVISKKDEELVYIK